MVRSCIISWKRSRLLVPMGCSSSSLHNATSCGRSRCSSVSSSSKSLENFTMSLVLGCSPVCRTYSRQVRRVSHLQNNFTICNMKKNGFDYQTNLLYISGEPLSLVSNSCFIPPGHLSNGLLQELGQLQFSSKSLLLFFLLSE